jgi:hypothetical protein
MACPREIGIDLWSELAAKLGSTHSVPEILQAYQKCVAQRMQMAAEDGRQLFEECQKITQKSAGRCPMAGRRQVSVFHPKISAPLPKFVIPGGTL